MEQILRNRTDVVAIEDYFTLRFVPILFDVIVL